MILHHTQDNCFERANKKRRSQSKTLGGEHNISLLLLNADVSCAVRKGIFFFSRDSRNIVAFLPCSSEAGGVFTGRSRNSVGFWKQNGLK